MTNWLEFRVTYTETWRRIVTTHVDEAEIRDWIGKTEDGGSAFEGEVTGEHVTEFLDSDRDEERTWMSRDPIDGFDDEFVDHDIESAEATRKQDPP